MMYFDQFKSIAKPLLLAGSTLLAVMVLTATAAASKPAAAPVYEIAQSGGFSQEERRIIYDVLDAVDRNIGDDENRGKGGKSKDNGNGQDGLPPGIAMKLERGGTLPRGLPSAIFLRICSRVCHIVRMPFARLSAMMWS